MINKIIIIFHNYNLSIGVQDTPNLLQQNRVNHIEYNYDQNIKEKI